MNQPMYWISLEYVDKWYNQNIFKWGTTSSIYEGSIVDTTYPH